MWPEISSLLLRLIPAPSLWSGHFLRTAADGKSVCTSCIGRILQQVLAFISAFLELKLSLATVKPSLLTLSSHDIHMCVQVCISGDVICVFQGGFSPAQRGILPVR